MASQFVGDTVVVTLNNPRGAKIQGVVANVVDQRLTMRDGALPIPTSFHGLADTDII
jgi:hypothetical protein